MTLTRRDIAETSIRTIGTFLTALGVVAAGIGFFVSMGTELRAQQAEVVNVQYEMFRMREDMDQLRLDMDQLTGTVETLARNQKQQGEVIDEILMWVREQQPTEQDPETVPSAPDEDE